MYIYINILRFVVSLIQLCICFVVCIGFRVSVKSFYIVQIRITDARRTLRMYEHYVRKTEDCFI